MFVFTVANCHTWVMVDMFLFESDDDDGHGGGGGGGGEPYLFNYK